MKNEKGISLIALIITIIVIIILAAIVIGSVLNAPDQANFAKYCQDYSEIQSAVSTQGAIIYGELATATDITVKNLKMDNVYWYICTHSQNDYKTDTTPAASEQPKTVLDLAPTEGGVTDGKVTINSEKNMLGLSSVPDYQTWTVSVKDGKLTSNGFSYNNGDGAKEYITPTEIKPAA